MQLNVHSLFVVVGREGMKYSDHILKQLCSESDAARKAWRAEDRPVEGALYDNKLRLRRAVRRTKVCAATSTLLPHCQ